MSFHRNKMLNTAEIKEGLKLHGLEVNKPSQLSDSFRVGFLYAQECCLKAIADIGPNKNENVMSGHEDAYRAVENLFQKKGG